MGDNGRQQQPLPSPGGRWHALAAAAHKRDDVQIEWVELEAESVLSSICRLCQHCRDDAGIAVGCRQVSDCQALVDDVGMASVAGPKANGGHARPEPAL